MRRTRTLRRQRGAGDPLQVRVRIWLSITPLLGQEPAGIMLPHVEGVSDAAF